MNVRTAAALALAAAATQPAFAQQADPVTLYGRAYGMFESVQASEGAAPVARRSRISDRNSILGVRGTENLGGGLKAFYQFETLWEIDSAGTFATRNSAVGLQGGWGSVLMGRWDTPFKVAHAAAVDAFTDLALPDITAGALNQGNFARRETNTIQYWSPTFANTSLRAHYAANEGKTATLNPYSYGASLTWRAGAGYVAYAYEKHKDQSRATATAGIDEDGHALSATWRVGPVKLSGQYGEYRRTRATKQKGWYAGAEWNVANHALLASWQDSKGGGATTDAAQPGCTVLGLGYRYEFSRRTAFVAEYAQVKNKVASLCNFGTSPLTITANQDPKGLGAGFRHTF